MQDKSLHPRYRHGGRGGTIFDAKQHMDSHFTHQRGLLRVHTYYRQGTLQYNFIRLQISVQEEENDKTSADRRTLCLYLLIINTLSKTQSLCDRTLR